MPCLIPLEMKRLQVLSQILARLTLVILNRPIRGKLKSV